MKKHNPIAVALIVLAVLGSAATSYLAVDAAARRDEAQTNLDTQLKKLEQFNRQKPTEKKLAFIKESTEDYRKELKSYREVLASMKEDSAKINPQEFQDDVRTAADALRKKALEKNVALPKDFFYGFDQYQAAPPPQQDVVELDREFKVVRRLVDGLVDLKIGSIGALKRQEAQTTAAQAPTPQPDKNAPAAAQDSLPAITSKNFSITFTAPQEKFLTAFNMIQESKQFLLIRSLLLDNTNPNPPARIQPGQSPAAPGVPGSATRSPSSETIQAILGRESVTATLAIEILDFPAWNGESSTPPK